MSKDEEYLLNSTSIPSLNIQDSKVGVKFDTGKPRVSLLSSKALLEVSKVATMGADKYGDYNYLGGMKWSRLLDASLRHILAFNGGERTDEESGLSHLAHAAWNILALIEYEKNNLGEDNLYKLPVKS